MIFGNNIVIIKYVNDKQTKMFANLLNQIENVETKFVDQILIQYLSININYFIIQGSVLIPKRQIIVNINMSHDMYIGKHFIFLLYQTLENCS